MSQSHIVVQLISDSSFNETDVLILNLDATNRKASGVEGEAVVAFSVSVALAMLARGMSIRHGPA